MSQKGVSKVVGESITLSEFFERKNSFYVPLFQRGYSWEASEVSRLIADLWQAHGGASKRDMFLGSLVTQSQPESRQLNLIDGQQRFTTINLMMIALREMFKLAGHDAAVITFDEHLKTPKDPDSVIKGGENQPFLTLGDCTNELFSSLVNEGELYDKLCEVRQTKSEQERRLLNALELWLDFLVSKALGNGLLLTQIQQWFALGEKIPTYKHIKQYALFTPSQSRPDTDSNASTGSQASRGSHAADLTRQMDASHLVFNGFYSSMRKRTYMLWAKTYDLSWAFHVFKSMNDTGRPLTDIDKLKALVLNCWKHGNDGQIERAKQWNRSIEQAGGEKPFKHVIIHMAVAHGMDKRMSLLDYMENCYTVTVANRAVRLFEQQAAALQFMNTLVSLCNLYKAMTYQDTTLFPMSLRRSASGVNTGQHQGGATVEQERRVSKLLCLLSLLEAGVRPKKGKASKGKATGQANDTVNNAHMMPALVLLQTCQDVKQYDTKQAITILEALERRAAFYGVTWSASKGKYRWSRDMQELAEGNTAHNRLARYLEVVRAIQHREPAHEVVKHLMLTTPEKALFAQQLITVARTPASCALGDAVLKRIANFTVRKHELTINKGEHDFPENTLEHICPQKPKVGCWKEWTLEGPTNSHLQNAEYDDKCHKLQSRAVRFVSAGLIYDAKCAKGTVWSPSECTDRCGVLIKVLLEAYGLPDVHQDYTGGDREDPPDDEEDNDGDIDGEDVGYGMPDVLMAGAEASQASQPGPSFGRNMGSTSQTDVAQNAMVQREDSTLAAASEQVSAAEPVKKKHKSAKTSMKSTAAAEAAREVLQPDAGQAVATPAAAKLAKPAPKKAAPAEKSADASAAANAANSGKQHKPSIKHKAADHTAAAAHGRGSAAVDAVQPSVASPATKAQPVFARQTGSPAAGGQPAVIAGDAGGVGKTSKRKREAPVLPRSAKDIYAARHRGQVRRDNPGKDLKKIMSEQWAALSPENRHEWVELAVKDKVRHETEKEALLR